ncbi:MAG: DUF5689 domain-containing protein [Flavobacteriaceae bacterium]|nr:DUF5689 domain-containing protein [Flavobacteriaceae bacterium]
MKTIFKSILYVSLTSLILTGCAKNDDFTTPNMENCKEPEIKANKTIADYYAQATKELKVVTNDDIISGVLVSSDLGGNFYRDLYLVSEDGTQSMRVKVNKGGTYGDYNVGRVLHIKMKGLFYQVDNGVLTIGQQGDKGFTGAINAINKHVFRSCTTVGGNAFEEKYNNKVTLKEAVSDKYLGKLVTISDVQFKEKFWNKTFYDKDNIVSPTNNATNVEIESKQKDVNNKVIFRVAAQAAGFVNEKVPAKSGTMTGVMTKYIDDFQFVPRTMADLNLKQDPFTGDGTIDPGGEIVVEPGKFNVFPGSDFEKWDDFLKVILKNSVGDPMAKEGKGLGWKGSVGLQVQGVAALGSNGKGANGALFTVQGVKAPADATKLSFLMKGKAGKSISINVYKANGTNYVAYNLENVNGSKMVTANLTETVYDGVPSGNTTNSYTGVIDTKDQWVKVVLDLKSMKVPFNTSGTNNLIAFRYGHTETYDLVIDDIKFEDGTPIDDEGPVDPGTPEPSDEYFPKNAVFLTDMKTETAFLETLNSFGVTKDLGVFAIGAGPDKTNAFHITAANTKTNPYLFTFKADGIPANKEKVSFYVKGTASRSLSFNIVKDGKDIFCNSEAISTTAVLINTVVPNNGYDKTIDTKDKWTKVTIDLSKVAPGYNAGTGDFLKVKLGSKSGSYDVYLSAFFFE